MTHPAGSLPTRWVVAPPADPAASGGLAAALGIPLPLARLLVQRGIADAESARTFLRPALEQLADPFALKGMDTAVEVLVAAIRAGDTILVHGDYDVDGQSATAILTRGLRAAGGTVVPFVPHRLRDGYDFGMAGLEEARRVGAKVILTCDCGITAVETVRQAREAGIAVVVTDHHLPGAELPPANAVVDPQQAGDTSGLTMLCGSGVAFKLVQALAQVLGLSPNLPLHLLDYTALATIADVVPLVGENRILVRHGLRLLAQSRWPGLQALIASSGLAGKELRAGQVGFMLAPRLNAAGRVSDAAEGLRLLLTDDPAEARTLADTLNQYNTERQAMENRILESALAQVQEGLDLARDAAFVLGAEGWHPGVIGIVASRIVERYGRPTFVIGFDGQVGKGSGRSISRFDLHGALLQCGDLLDRFGGHRMAAGLTVRRERFEAFRERFGSVAREHLEPATLAPEQRIDMELGLEEATDDLERLLRAMEPTGMGNPGPVFGVRGVTLDRPGIVGKGHLKGVLRGNGGTLSSIGFNLGDRLAAVQGRAVDVAIRLEQNEFNGRATLQGRLLSIAPAADGPPA